MPVTGMTNHYDTFNCIAIPYGQITFVFLSTAHTAAGMVAHAAIDIGRMGGCYHGRSHHHLE